MTCEEFNAALRTDPMSHTRAFRASVVAHAGDCPECRLIAEILVGAVQSGAIKPDNPDDLEKYGRMADEDEADPEYREIAFGEKPDGSR